MPIETDRDEESLQERLAEGFNQEGIYMDIVPYAAFILDETSRGCSGRGRAYSEIAVIALDSDEMFKKLKQSGRPEDWFFENQKFRGAIDWLTHMGYIEVSDNGGLKATKSGRELVDKYQDSV